MKFDFLYLIGVLLALLAEAAPGKMPVHTPEFADVLFLMYIVVSGGLPRKGNPYGTWMIVVYAFFLLSMAWGLDLWTCYWGLRQVFVVFIGMLASYRYMKCTPDGVKNILKVYLVESFILVVFIFLNIDQFEQGVRLGQQLGDDEETALNSNIIAINLCYAIYCGFVIFGQGKKNMLNRLMFVASVALFLYLILLTGSRKSLLMLAIPLLVFAFLQKSKRKGFVVLLVASSVIVVGGYAVMNIPMLYDIMGSRVEEMFNILSGNVETGDDVSRMFLITYGIEWFKEQPLLGYGINNFRILSNNTSMFAGQNFYAHNNYIELLVDVGIIGFLIYYSCLVYIWKKLKGNFSDSILNKWVASLIVVRLFLDFAMVSYYSFTSNLILCLCFYAVYVSRKSKVASKTTQKMEIAMQ